MAANYTDSESRILSLYQAWNSEIVVLLLLDLVGVLVARSLRKLFQLILSRLRVFLYTVSPIWAYRDTYVFLGFHQVTKGDMR